MIVGTCRGMLLLDTFTRQYPNKFGFALDLFVYLQIINYYNIQ